MKWNKFFQILSKEDQENFDIAKWIRCAIFSRQDKKTND